jgi:predicted Zn-ribbon and HTH transcriptional regulator
VTSTGEGATRRQQIAQLLVQGPWGFHELRRELELTVQQLEDDLRHLARSARHGPARLQVEPARCSGCGFEFGDPKRRHFHPPSRCPRCRSERITGPRLSLG